MNNTLKKLALIILSSLLFINSLALPLTALAAPIPPKPTPTSAPTTSTSSWYNQNPFTWYAKVHDYKNPSEIFGERYTAAQVQWIMYSLITFIPTTLETFNTKGPCLMATLGGGTDIVSCVTSYFETVIDLLNELGITQSDSSDVSLAELIFDQPNRDISAINYFKNSFNKFAIIQPVNAQEGFDFGAIGIVQNLWKATRNFSYAIIVLITIIFAFMIMFRVKLSPQLVISVQSALPKIISVLILATFSFAIAGLMVDLMYVFMGIMSALLASVDITGLGGGNPGFFKLTYMFISGEWLGVHVSGFLVVFLYMFIYTILFVISLIVSFFAAMSSISIFGMVLSILFLLVAVWLIILCFVYMIRIPWILIKTLANIYMSVIIAPLQITFGAIAPQAGFGTWLKNLVANLLVFPVTGIFFWLAYMLILQSLIAGAEVGFERSWPIELARMFGFNIQGILPGNLWSPPLLGSGAEITGLIFAIMSFMVIVAIPKATEIVKMLIMGEKFAFGTAIGEAMGPLKWAGGQAYNQTGAKDIMEISQLARKSRVLEKIIGDKGWLRPYVERFVGGTHNQASTAINNATDRYKTSAGRAQEVG